MREFKFRAWDVGYSKMHYNVGLVGNTVIFSFFQEDGEHDFELEYWGDHDGVPIMQYTGFKNMQGRDIYGGDYLLSKHRQIGEVYWCKEELTWMVYWRKGDIKDYDSCLIHCFNCEVIGNIYETPELMEVEK